MSDVMIAPLLRDGPSLAGATFASTSVGFSSCDWPASFLSVEDIRAFFLLVFGDGAVDFSTL